ncbi:MAG TPA: DegT/DnrJ/EryC1/StrS family aminotransferase, partial [Gammaproteobacteria bacterium]|nr:DegT/DnrJ/EryC1/StrS family aminotransferase [Gammaproteobacteria bacterium]
MQIPFINLQAQYQAYQAQINQVIHTVLESGQYIMGPQIEELEKNLARFVGSEYAITCSNGSDAQLLALMAINVKPGDEVITTPFTFVSTASMIALLGAIPVFVDITADTFHINPDKISEKITAKTKAIIPVSIFGQVADMDEINAIALLGQQKYGQKIYVIEDAAQSFGAEYKGKKSGHLSDMAYTSFFPSKPLGCYGDGGALFTDDAALADKLKKLRLHGQSQRYQHQFIGINGRLDTLQAAILNVKLNHFPKECVARAALGERYTRLLNASKNIVCQGLKSDRTSVYAQYSVLSPQRAQILEGLAAKGIPTAIHYPKPLHLQACFADLN